MISREPTYKESQFRQFLLSRNPSVKFAKKYIKYLNHSIVKNVTMQIASVNSIFEVTEMSHLLLIYGMVKANANNIRLHNVYSGIISAYIKFLNGQDLRKRVMS